MSHKMFLIALGTTLVTAATVMAQQPQQPAAPSDPGSVRTDTLRQRRHERLGEPGFRRMRGMKETKSELGMARSLNITEEQRQQRQAIVQRHLAATKSQREQLFQLSEKRLAGTLTSEDQARAATLRQELRESRRTIHTESLAVLTAEQRSQLEAFREQRRLQREEMLKRRQELRRNKPLNQEN